MNKCTPVQDKKACIQKQGSANVQTFQIKDHLHACTGKLSYVKYNATSAVEKITLVWQRVDL